MTTQLKILALAAALFPSACLGAHGVSINASDVQALARHGIFITRVGTPGETPAQFDIRFRPSAPAMIRIRDSGNKGALVAVAAPKDTDTKVSVYLMAIEDVTEVSFLIFPQERPEALASISVDVKLSAGQNAKPPPRGPSPANPTVPDTPTLPNRPNQTTQPQPRNTP